jgi:hypothetical protein
MAILSTMVAAMLLSRAVNDKRFLQAGAESVLFIPVAMRQPKAELQA